MKWEEDHDSDGAAGPFFDGGMDEADYDLDAEDVDFAHQYVGFE